MPSHRLTKYEMEIMDVIWRRGPSTVQEVCDGLSRELAYTTVMTTLRLLEQKKRVLLRTKKGRAFVYEAVVSRDQVSRDLLNDFREVLFGKSLPSLMLNLLEEGQLSDDDVAALKAALERLEKK